MREELLSRLHSRVVLWLVVVPVVVVGLVYQYPIHYRVNVGGRDDTIYVSGMNGREAAEDLDWRWTQSMSQVIFRNGTQIVPRGWVAVSFAGIRPEASPQPRVSLSVNGASSYSLTAARSFQVQQMELPDSPFAIGDWDLTIAADTFTTPADPRRLGVQLDWVELQQAPPPVIPSLPTLVFSSALVVGVFVLARKRAGENLALVLALSSICALALGLLLSREYTVLLLVWAGPLALLYLATSLLLPSPPIIYMRRWLGKRPRAATLAGLVGMLAAELFAFYDSQVISSALLAIGAAFIWQTGNLVPANQASGQVRFSRVQVFLLPVALTAVALLFRVYRLDSVPFAIFRDEARHGLVALRMLRDPNFHPLFLGPPINQPIPYFYALAASIQLLGTNLTALRLVSALAGVLAVPLLWLWARRLFDLRVANLAALGLAVSTWHVAVSRFAVNYVEPTLFAIPAYFFLWNGLARRRLLPVAASAALIGLAQYQSQTSRVLFIVAGALCLDFAWSGFRSRDHSYLRFWAGGLAVSCVVGLVVIAPLAFSAVGNYQAFTARSDQVALWSSSNGEGDYLPALIVQNAARYAASFNIAGDNSGRLQLPGLPLLDPLLGVLFLVGVTVALHRLVERRFRFVLYWLLAGLVPGIITVDAPNLLRVIEAAPPALVLAGIGGVAIWSALEVRGRRRLLSHGVLLASIAFVVAFNFADYFVFMYDSPQVWRKYGAIGTPLGEALGELYAAGRIQDHATLFVPKLLLDVDDENYAIQFLAHGRVTIRPYDPPAELPKVDGAALYAIPNYEDYARLMGTVHPGSDLDKARQQQPRWREQLAGAISGAEEITGESFPGSNSPSFWLYLEQ